MEIPFIESLWNSAFREGNVHGSRILTFRLIYNRIMIDYAPSVQCGKVLLFNSNNTSACRFLTNPARALK